MLSIFRARNSDGRHARQQQAPAAPHLVVPAPRPPATLGGGARLTASLPAALIEAADVHAHLLAGVLLNAGEGFRDVAVSAPEDAAEAYVRWLEGEVERLKGQPPCTEAAGGASAARRLKVRFTTPSPKVAEQVAALYGHPLISVEPKTGKPVGAQVQQEQIAAYRHMTESDPGADEQKCPDCGHPWAWHASGGGCNADGVMCECEQAAPITEERM
jgi:hypothetical protein